MQEFFKTETIQERVLLIGVRSCLICRWMWWRACPDWS